MINTAGIETAARNHEAAKRNGQGRVPLVMLVDDSSIDNFVNRRVMEKAGFAKQVIVFTRPDKALEYLGQSGGKGNKEDVPRLLFLDLNMPRISGEEFLEEFENLPAAVTGHCRVVVLTGFLHRIHTTEALRHKHPCVIHCIEKPLDESSLALIANTLRNHQT